MYLKALLSPSLVELFTIRMDIFECNIIFCTHIFVPIMVQHFSNCLLTAHISTLSCSHASLSTKSVYMEKCVWVTGSIYITYQCAAALCRFAAAIRASGLKGVTLTPSRVKHIFCHLYIKAVFHQNPFFFKPIPCGTAATVFEVTIFAA